MPFLVASQNQKHVTMNESLSRLDVLVQLSVKSQVLLNRPANPVEGERYIIATGAMGDWVGLDGKLSYYQDATWLETNAKTGWLCWVEDEAKIYVFDGISWNEHMPKENVFSPDVMVCEEMGYGQDSTNPPVTGWNERYLNLLKINSLGAGVELEPASNRFKLPVGRYWVKIMAAAMRVGKHKVDLRNNNTANHLIQGSCEHSQHGATSSASLSRSTGEGKLIVSDASHYFSLMHHVELGGTDNWQFGSAGEGPSINCKVELWRL